MRNLFSAESYCLIGGKSNHDLTFLTDYSICKEHKTSGDPRCVPSKLIRLFVRNLSCIVPTSRPISPFPQWWSKRHDYVLDTVGTCFRLIGFKCRFQITSNPF